MDHYPEYQYKKNILTHWFHNSVPVFCHWNPVIPVFSQFSEKKNWSYWREFSQFYICLAVSHVLTSSFRRGTLQKQNSLRHSTKSFLPRVAHAKLLITLFYSSSCNFHPVGPSVFSWVPSSQASSNYALPSTLEGISCKPNFKTYIRLKTQEKHLLACYCHKEVTDGP